MKPNETYAVIDARGGYSDRMSSDEAQDCKYEWDSIGLGPCEIVLDQPEPAWRPLVCHLDGEGMI